MKILKVVAVIAALCYPFIIYYLRSSGLEPRYFAALLVLFMIFSLSGNGLKAMKYILGAVWLVVISLLIYFNNNKVLMIYPVLMNAAMFSVFFISLFHPPAMVEKFALLKEKSLAESAVIYCRKVTIVWCVFFVVNAGASLITIFISMRVWALYNGVISYIFMGVLFTGEYAIRRIYIGKVNA